MPGRLPPLTSYDIKFSLNFILVEEFRSNWAKFALSFTLLIHNDK